MKDSKNLVIGLLCTVLCIMAVAYAAFSTSLTINGTASVDSTWSVAITAINCETEKGLANGVDITKPSVSGLNTLSATVGVSFNQPGDNMTCTVTITNAGTLDAKLASITTTPSTIENTTSGGAAMSDFIWYTIGEGEDDTAEKDAVLGKDGQTHTYTIYAEYRNVVDENGQSVALPTVDDVQQNSRQISVTFNYVQNLAA